ncbi:MAG: HNH endonuclease [Chloroflexota bacterium]
MPKRYCQYCGRVAHRCQCGDDDSDLQAFFARTVPAPPDDYFPKHMDIHYIRGVPPQVKRKRRYELRKHYDSFYADLCAEYGEQCFNCRVIDGKLVLDHIISIAKGGTSTYDNLQLLCEACNRVKGKLCIDCRPLLADDSHEK